MNEPITVIFGHWKKILMITVLTSLTATVFGVLLSKDAYSTTIFINIGAAREATTVNAENHYDSLLAADHFTESVQGWFKNPSFLREIGSQSGHETDFSVRKQEKQNLLVTFSTISADSAEEVAMYTKETLKQRISDYNDTNSSGFTLSAFDTDIGKSSLSLWVFPVMGGPTGIVAGYLLVLLWITFMREHEAYRRSKT